MKHYTGYTVRLPHMQLCVPAVVILFWPESRPDSRWAIIISISFYSFWPIEGRPEIAYYYFQRNRPVRIRAAYYYCYYHNIVPTRERRTRLGDIIAVVYPHFVLLCLENMWIRVLGHSRKTRIIFALRPRLYDGWTLKVSEKKIKCTIILRPKMRTASM